MNRKTLGTGWGFPIRVTPRGGLTYVSGETLIQQSIWIILATAPGERQMLPAFGCGIHNYVFAPNTPANWGDIAHQVRIALTRWEPRIDVLDVRVDDGAGDPTVLLIRVDYRIRATNAIQNLVYPFYIQEGAQP